MQTTTGYSVTRAESPQDIDLARRLMIEYRDSIAVSLCFQNFDGEMAALPGKYAPPGGRILIARDAAGDPAGVIAVRAFKGDICEMKRMFVRPMHRGRGVGKLLVTRLFEEARALGYRRMNLDTEDTMVEAVGLYRAMGFQPIDRYNDDPHPHTLWFSREL